MGNTSSYVSPRQLQFPLSMNIERIADIYRRSHEPLVRVQAASVLFTMVAAAAPVVFAYEEDHVVPLDELQRDEMRLRMCEKTEAINIQHRAVKAKIAKLIRARLDEPRSPEVEEYRSLIRTVIPWAAIEGNTKARWSPDTSLSKTDVSMSLESLRYASDPVVAGLGRLDIQKMMTGNALTLMMGWFDLHDGAQSQTDSALDYMIKDLEQRLAAVRSAVQAANQAASIGDVARSANCLSLAYTAMSAYRGAANRARALVAPIVEDQQVMARVDAGTKASLQTVMDGTAIIPFHLDVISPAFLAEQRRQQDVDQQETRDARVDQASGHVDSVAATQATERTYVQKRRIVAA